jgi:asparagine synthetase B (glutamine-hydrolysing)
VTELAPVEIASGFVFGTVEERVRLPRAGADVVAAIEAAARPALERSPCLISFSGGRDSSLVLAVAMRLARREGLPEPVPATNRVPGAGADERAWQERVVAHLGVRDWLRLELDGELDALGPHARGVMRSHGLLWPFNLHFHAPLLAAARGGALMTGIGGDELFAAATRPTRGRARAVARVFAPARVRARRLAARRPATFPWLSAAGRRAVGTVAAAHDAAEPQRLRPRMRWVRSFRYLHIGLDGLARLAGEAGVALAHPLADAGTWAALASAGAPRGFADRTSAMRAPFGAMLPDSVLARASKAHFDEVFWGEQSRAFARAWDGGGVPEELVDRRALREHWRSDAPLVQSLTMLQAAWLASGVDDLGEPISELGQDVHTARAAQAPHGM